MHLYYIKNFNKDLFELCLATEYGSDTPDTKNSKGFGMIKAFTVLF